MRSDTYLHCLLVIPIALYLIWRRQAVLATEPVRPSILGVLAIAGFGAVWIIGVGADAQGLMQLAAIGTIPSLVIALFGVRWAGRIAFPLCFLFLAVPVGEGMVPILIEWTADFTVGALRLSGVPVYREGNFFMIPSGSWSVIDGCSGVRYLIASVFLGILYSHLMYRTWPRRVMFVTMSILVPIVANWLRAYGIVMLAHLTNNRLATGVDHLIYGWVFFGVVMLLLLWVGAHWRQDRAPESHAQRAPPAVASGVPSYRSSIWLLAGVMLAVIVWTGTAIGTVPASSTCDVRFDMTAADGWQSIDRISEWKPLASGPYSETTLGYAKGDARVGVHVATFRSQRQGAELVSGTNMVASPNDDRWHILSERRLPRGEERAVDVRSTTLRGASETLLVWDWYWTGRRFTSSDWRAKFDLLADRAARRPDFAAWISVYAEAGSDPANDSSTQGTLGRFIDANLPALEAALRSHDCDLAKE